MNINYWYWSRLSSQQRQSILGRAGRDLAQARQTAEEIIALVRQQGAAAIRQCLQRFDGVDLQGRPLMISEEEFEAAAHSLPTAVKEALHYAMDNVTAVHRRQVPQPQPEQMVRPGIWVAERYRPIDSAALYVPRGRGAFPSMLYMMAIPATIAAVPRLCVATPPNSDGSVDAASLYVARQLGITTVYRCGGAQAIAALAYGVDEIAPVDKIVGPGGSIVSAAKRAVSTIVDVGLLAGPSESMILADDSADPWSTALDLLIEAEHGADSAALLVTPSRQLADQVARLIPTLVAEAPEPRGTFLRQVFEGYGGIIVADDMSAAVSIVNSYAPEHLQLRVCDQEAILATIDHAGEILLGEHSAFSLANYAVGANAVLPTGGTARTWSSMSVQDFLKRTSVIRVDAAGRGEMQPHVMALAEYEGFFFHHQALRRRDRA